MVIKSPFKGYWYCDKCVCHYPEEQLKKEGDKIICEHKEYFRRESK